MLCLDTHAKGNITQERDHRPALVPAWSHFLQPLGLRQGFQFFFILMSGISLLSALSGPGYFQWTAAASPSPNPRRALASMTANPLHHLGLIRAQWQMISLHIKALKQLNKLASSQSLAQELALNSEVLPAGTAELLMKAREPHAEAHRRSSASQGKKWILTLSSPNCEASSLSPWLSTSKPSFGCCLKFTCSRLSVLWGLIYEPMSYGSPLLL